MCVFSGVALFGVLAGEESKCLVFGDYDDRRGVVSKGGTVTAPFLVLQGNCGDFVV